MHQAHWIRRARLTGIWQEILHTTSTSGFAILSTAGVVAITARALGPEGRGLYAAATSWVALFAIFGSLSLGLVVVGRVAGQPPEHWLRDVLGTMIALVLLVAAIEMVVVILTYAVTGGQLYGHLSIPILAFAFAVLPFAIFNEHARVLLNITGAIRGYNAALVIAQLAGLVSVAVLLLWIRTGIEGAVLGFVLSSLILSTLTMMQLLRKAGGLRVRKQLAVDLAISGAKLHPNAIGSYLFAQSSVLILNYFRPAEETAYYQLAMQIFGTLLLIPSAIGTVGFRLVGQHGPDAAWVEQRHLLARGVGISLAGIAAGYVLAPIGVLLIAGDQFMPASDLLRLSLFALIGGTFSSVMASQWIGRGLFWQVSVLTLLVGLASVVLDLVFIPLYGMFGAVVSTLVTYSVAIVGNGAMAVWVERRVGRTGILKSE